MQSQRHPEPYVVADVRLLDSGEAGAAGPAWPASCFAPVVWLKPNQPWHCRQSLIYYFSLELERKIVSRVPCMFLFEPWHDVRARSSQLLGGHFASAMGTDTKITQSKKLYCRHPGHISRLFSSPEPEREEATTASPAVEINTLNCEAIGGDLIFHIICFWKCAASNPRDRP